MTTVAFLANLATAIGALIGAASLYIGFRLYRFGQRDAYTREFRKSLHEIQANFDRLDRLWDSDLMHELSYSVFYRDDTYDMFERMQSALRLDESVSDREAMADLFKKRSPYKTFPPQSQSGSRFTYTLEKTGNLIAPYKFSFPGLYACITSANKVLSNVYHLNIRPLHKEELWADIFSSIDRSDLLSMTPRMIAQHFHTLFVAMLMSSSKDNGIQDDINDLRRMVSLTSEAYLGLTDDQIYSQARKRESRAGQAVAQGQYISQTLRNAEDFLETALTDRELRDYRESLARFEARNPPQRT